MENKIITFGEIMLRLAPPSYLRYSQAYSFDATYGGGEANVAISLANYVKASAYESVAKQLMQKYPKSQEIIITLRGSINANHNTWSGLLFDGKKLY